MLFTSEQGTYSKHEYCILGGGRKEGRREGEGWEGGERGEGKEEGKVYSLLSHQQ